MCVSVVDRGGRELVGTRHLAGVLYPHPTEDRQIKHTPPPIETREKKKKRPGLRRIMTTRRHVWDKIVAYES